MAKHSEIQQRVQHEIDNVLAANGGKITYESLSEMKYLEACIEGSISITNFFLFCVNKIESILLQRPYANIRFWAY